MSSDTPKSRALTAADVIEILAALPPTTEVHIDLALSAKDSFHCPSVLSVVQYSTSQDCVYLTAYAETIPIQTAL
jgi:hypothetical protein